MFFKVGIEEIMKFLIGVIINSMGEVFVGDTGNYVVRVYNSEGKYFRDIGKEVRFQRSYKKVNVLGFKYDKIDKFF